MATSEDGTGHRLLTRVAPSPDQPVEARDGDLLERGEFARTLAAQIGAADERGLVMALTGPWGSGKTSLLNLIAETLRVNEGPIIVRFNPWYFSGTDQLIEHFFIELGEQLGKSGTLMSKIGAKFKSYGALLAPWGLVPVVGAAGKTIVALGDLLQERPSLHQQREELVGLLSSATERIVVMVDDIDRLEAGEVRQLMRLVRLVGDFPKVVYLLAYDSRRVTRALSDDGDLSEGRRYLEKIVQLSYQVPEIRPGELSKLLDEQVSAVLGSERMPEDETRIAGLVTSVLDPLVTTVRDVRRYVNVLPFALELLSEGVNPVDVLALEAMRVFMPELFERLPEIADSIEGLAEVDEDDRTAGPADLVASLRESAKPHGSVHDAMMELLFPGFVSGEREQDDESDWVVRRRVADPDVLRAYLEKVVPGDVAPTSIVRAVTERIVAGVSAAPQTAALGEDQFVDLIRRLPRALQDRRKAPGGDAPLTAPQASAALATLLNRIGDVSAGRRIPRTGLGAIYDLVNVVAGRVPEADRCEAARLTLDATADLRMKQLALDGFRSTDGKTRVSIDKDCARPLRKEVAERVLTLDVDELAAHPALSPLLNWILRAGGGSKEAVLDRLKNEEVLIQYLSTTTVIGIPNLLKEDSMPQLVAQVEPLLRGSSDPREARAARRARAVIRGTSGSSGA
jgi:hypothetical protein